MNIQSSHKAPRLFLLYVNDSLKTQIQYALGKWQMHAKFWLQNMKGRDHLE